MRAALWMVVGLGCAPVAGAAEPLACATVRDLIDTRPEAEVLAAIDAADALSPDLLACLRRRGAPAAVLDALAARGLSDETAQVVLTVDDESPTWPNEVGAVLAETARDALPGAVAFALLRDGSLFDGAGAAWWWFDVARDRVYNAMLAGLPENSTAAESDTVLGEDAPLLLDEATRFDAERRLVRTGFRRLLVVSEAPVSGTDAVELRLRVRDLDADTTQDIVRRVSRTASALDDADVSTEVQPSPAAPGTEVLLRVALQERDGTGPASGRTVEVLPGGEPVEAIEVAQGRYSAILRVPPTTRDAWTLSWTYTTAAGGLVSHEVIVPIAVPDATLASTTTRTRKRKGTGGALVGTGIALLGGGAALLTQGLLWNRQLSAAEFDLTRDTYRQATDAQLYGGAAAMAAGIGLIAGGSVMLAPTRGGLQAAIAMRLP